MPQVFVSFLADELVIRRGGVAANIAFGLAQLGMRPVLLSAVGKDFEEHRASLRGLGVECDFIHVSDKAHTALHLRQLLSLWKRSSAVAAAGGSMVTRLRCGAGGDPGRSAISVIRASPLRCAGAGGAVGPRYWCRPGRHLGERAGPERCDVDAEVAVPGDRVSAHRPASPGRFRG
ncbi:PfkB family carbohydrate kinase [Micromonospora echinofusca]|uniref:PfkB family carbohydrate kinase n=1 Tax=Micromonospora echinofusca TaxID=47858 RepID=UPI0033F7E925